MPTYLLAKSSEYTACCFAHHTKEQGFSMKIVTKVRGGRVPVEVDPGTGGGGGGGRGCG
jgi:hypothetical protein